MMHTRCSLAVTFTIALAGGCSNSKPATPAPSEKPTGTAPAAPTAATPTTPAPAGAETPPASGVPQEDTLRAGKKTGLGGAAEKPEVATEELIAAIGDGRVAPSRLIDPAKGIVRRIIMPGGGDGKGPDKREHLCGADAEKALVDVSTYVVGSEAKGMGYELGCSNRYVAAEDPELGKAGDRPARPMKYAVCSADNGAEYSAVYELVFVPDAERGLRFAGLLKWESGMSSEGPWADLADELTKQRPACEGAAPAAPAGGSSLPADAPVHTGAIEDSKWEGFLYDWETAAGKLRLEFATPGGSSLEVTALVDGGRVPVLKVPEVNVGGKTSLIVKPMRGKFLGVAILSDWSEGGDELSVDYAAEIRWEGTQAKVKELSERPGWAK